MSRLSGAHCCCSIKLEAEQAPCAFRFSSAVRPALELQRGLESSGSSKLWRSQPAAGESLQVDRNAYKQKLVAHHTCFSHWLHPRQSESGRRC
ncbi:hypothetical protein CEXT_142421 [Caerostris extrusa]|uniref:Uncharacterized protein n=1 Tax=Caerostris extrusa TaxID=172846 RepID=A0AAV4ULJ7_CAEEX|nr:hypothetical protein CEXT_142421 [Caerostris extrusa]